MVRLVCLAAIGLLFGSFLIVGTYVFVSNYVLLP